MSKVQQLLKLWTGKGPQASAGASSAARSAHGWEQNSPGARNCPAEAVHLLQHCSQSKRFSWQKLNSCSQDETLHGQLYSCLLPFI